jgi:RNA polymerase sigma-70 factor (ECF subfamily)
MRRRRSGKAAPRSAKEDGAERLRTTDALVNAARQGDGQAAARLVERYREPLRRWAAGRLPRDARGLLDTEDIVQETLLNTLQRVSQIDPGRGGGLYAYLRTALRNRIRDEVRRLRRSPAPCELPEQRAAPGASPLEETVGRETLDRYEAALKRLKREDQEAVIARVELGLDYDLLADSLGKPSRDAARMAVSRALVRLAREMGHE